MKIRYFTDTDILYVEFLETLIAETRDLDENPTIDVDYTGNLVPVTIEPANKHTRISEFS